MADGKEQEVDVNFYDFEQEEPNALIYDLTSCYNDSYSKNYVLTFPANDLLKGTEKSLKIYVHQTVMTVTGVSKQRIFVSEVVFIGKYMYAEFKLLARPDALGYSKSESLSKENTLEAAIAKLKESVSSKQFKVTVPVKDSVLILEPEPDGLNEFAGDRKLNLSGAKYKEGSVIALTIGMLFLGFLLGGVTLNLIISRKFGVSLFQRKTVTSDPFTNSLGESSM
ncbi:uncharacterized protein TNIN_268161 [Trichonephila inaurata madagascariensis]|uniref:DUF7959 domain-containing protein n=1 Tax=Trichonephila inaurata madagascariensis TaxID=2747483 RepID=A0A8X6XWW9_9ARAC|nr:uncharacterized protein TNIN_32611 [Trichonephila inaurata madagascariensis]GFY70127.1 uncharacterized protein TNIN_268161 [Trichonephila inaurata madagascariensis]